jgi:hypothetical protein
MHTHAYASNVGPSLINKPLKVEFEPSSQKIDWFPFLEYLFFLSVGGQAITAVGQIIWKL